MEIFSHRKPPNTSPSDLDDPLGSQDERPSAKRGARAAINSVHLVREHREPKDNDAVIQIWRASQKRRWRVSVARYPPDPTSLG